MTPTTNVLESWNAFIDPKTIPLRCRVVWVLVWPDEIIVIYPKPTPCDHDCPNVPLITLVDSVKEYVTCVFFKWLLAIEVVSLTQPFLFPLCVMMIGLRRWFWVCSRLGVFPSWDRWIDANLRLQWFGHCWIGLLLRSIGSQPCRRWKSGIHGIRSWWKSWIDGNRSWWGRRKTPVATLKANSEVSQLPCRTYYIIYIPRTRTCMYVTNLL